MNSKETREEEIDFHQSGRAGYPVDRSGLEHRQSKTLKMFMLIFRPGSAFFYGRAASPMRYLCLFDIFQSKRAHKREMFFCVRAKCLHAPHKHMFIYTTTTHFRTQLLLFTTAVWNSA